MSKTVQSCSQSIWPSSAGLEDPEFSNPTAKLKSTEHPDIPIGDRLIYVHVGFGFYYKCAANLILCGKLAKTEGFKIRTTLGGDS
jgi:hypothetical protein